MYCQSTVCQIRAGAEPESEAEIRATVTRVTAVRRCRGHSIDSNPSRTRLRDRFWAPASVRSPTRRTDSHIDPPGHPTRSPHSTVPFVPPPPPPPTADLHLESFTNGHDLVKWYIYVYTWYIHGIYTDMHVYTCMSLYIHWQIHACMNVYTCISMYIQGYGCIYHVCTSSSTHLHLRSPSQQTIYRVLSTEHCCIHQPSPVSCILHS